MSKVHVNTEAPIATSLSGAQHEGDGPTLLPCPFCLSDDTIVFGCSDRPDIFAVLCETCSAEGPEATSEVHAAKLWNRRDIALATQHEGEPSTEAVAYAENMMRWMQDDGREFHIKLAIGLGIFAARAVAAERSFQARVAEWMGTCFTPEICVDKIERNHRFLEEALELVQSLGCTASEAHQLVDYTFGRPQGDVNQEVGGVMVTLAALCLASGLDMTVDGETELARIWTKIDVIRAKQAGKPKHSPLPEYVAERAKPAASDLELAAQALGDGEHVCGACGGAYPPIEGCGAARNAVDARQPIPCRPRFREDAVTRVAAALAEARRAERERCARTADNA